MISSLSNDEVSVGDAYRVSVAYRTYFTVFYMEI